MPAWSPTPSAQPRNRSSESLVGTQGPIGGSAVFSISAESVSQMAGRRCRSSVLSPRNSRNAISRLHNKKGNRIRLSSFGDPEYSEESIMLEQSPLLSEAHLAIEHVHRLKRLTQQRPIGRRLQRRVRVLEEAALRMELEARAQSVCHWRAQGDLSCGLHSSESFGAHP